MARLSLLKMAKKSKIPKQVKLEKLAEELATMEEDDAQEYLMEVN